MSKAIPEPVTRLIEALSTLPNIGAKSAARITYFLLRSPDHLTTELAEALIRLKSQTRLCSTCFNIATDDPCGICNSPQRDASLIAVVEEPLDVLALERAEDYRGLYHVLHGAIQPSAGIGPDSLKIRELVARVARGGVVEVIVATNPSLEGDATARYIERDLAALKPLLGDAFPRLTRLARGLPIGGDIEYADKVTLLRALQGRSEL